MYSKDSHRDVFQKLMPHTAACKDSVMLFATITAVAIHAAVIFGIQFEDKSSPTAAVQEVTTVLTENLQKNEKADFIANAGQQGGGDTLTVDDQNPAI